MKPSIRYESRLGSSDSLSPMGTRQGTLGTALRPGSFAGTQSPEAKSKIEREYPDIVRSLTLLWGYPEMNDYFSKFWLDNDRAPALDPEVSADLMLLTRVHWQLVPARGGNKSDSVYGTSNGNRPVASLRGAWGSDTPLRRR
jgi:hypothetical protein